MADQDATIPHTTVRYKGADPILYNNDHLGIYERLVQHGDEIDVPTHEVEQWGDTPPADWERVSTKSSASASSGSKAAATAAKAETKGGAE